MALHLNEAAARWATGLGLAAATVLLAATTGCSTAVPVVLQSGKLPDLQGRVNVTAGYTGVITTENGVCRGSFTGFLGQAAIPLEVTCADGRRGIGTATITDGYFAGGEVRLSDGNRLIIRPRGPGFP